MYAHESQEPKRLITLLSEQRELYQRLRDLSERQRSLISSDRPEQLLSILRERQTLVARSPSSTNSSHPSAATGTYCTRDCRRTVRERQQAAARHQWLAACHSQNRPGRQRPVGGGKQSVGQRLRDVGAGRRPIPLMPARARALAGPWGGHDRLSTRAQHR